MYGRDQLRCLPQVALEPSAGTVSAAFAARGVVDLVQAFELVWSLAYGRNERADEPMAPLVESRGTCSTKHALLARLCGEQQVGVELRIGIYEMSGANTPGVDGVLRAHGLTFVPEAHCFLVFGGERIDVTRRVAEAPAAIEHFLYEESTEPGQIGEYKRRLHRRFIDEWAEASLDAHGLSGEALWAIREACIGAMSR